MKHASGQLRWKRARSTRLHSWLSFRRLLPFFFTLLMSAHLMKWGHSSVQQLSGTEMREDSAFMFMNLQQPFHRRPTNWPAAGEWCVMFRLIQVHFVITVAVWKHESRSEGTLDTPPAAAVERGSDGNLISSQLEPLPRNEIWKGILSGVAHYFIWNRTLLTQGNSIHQALRRLHFESTGRGNSHAKGFLIHRELAADTFCSGQKGKTEMEKFQKWGSCTWANKASG